MRFSYMPMMMMMKDYFGVQFFDLFKLLGKKLMHGNIFCYRFLSTKLRSKNLAVGVYFCDCVCVCVCVCVCGVVCSANESLLLLVGMF